MVILKAWKCGSLRTIKVATQTPTRNGGHSSLDRNQRLIKTTLHPSAAYISSEDYDDDPTLPKPPNFVKQFECMRLYPAHILIA